MSIPSVKTTKQMICTDKIASNKDMRSIIAAFGQRISKKEYVEITDFVNCHETHLVEIKAEESVFDVFEAEFFDSLM